MSRLRIALLATLVLGGVPLAAFAAPSGIVGVTVDCISGNTIPYAHVVVRGYGSIHADRELISDASGRFTALGLTPGLYYVGVHGSKYDSAYWGPHNMKLETNDVQHVRVGASAFPERRCPYGIPHHLLTQDQTTVD